MMWQLCGCALRLLLALGVTKARSASRLRVMQLLV